VTPKAYKRPRLKQKTQVIGGGGQKQKKRRAAKEKTQVREEFTECDQAQVHAMQ